MGLLQTLGDYPDWRLSSVHFLSHQEEKSRELSTLYSCDFVSFSSLFLLYSDRVPHSSTALSHDHIILLFTLCHVTFSSALHSVFLRFHVGGYILLKKRLFFYTVPTKKIYITMKKTNDPVCVYQICCCHQGQFAPYCGDII